MMNIILFNPLFIQQHRYLFRDENTKCSGSNKTCADHAVLLMYDNIHGH